MTPGEVVEHIVKLVREGPTLSQIGITLRDSHIPQVRFVTSNKILRILKSQGNVSPPLPRDASRYTHIRPVSGLAPSIHEGLYRIIKKGISVCKHLEVNRRDKDSKFCLILIWSRVHRLARYYKSRQVIQPNFKYDVNTASMLIA